MVYYYMVYIYHDQPCTDGNLQIIINASSPVSHPPPPGGSPCSSLLSPALAPAPCPAPSASGAVVLGVGKSCGEGQLRAFGIRLPESVEFWRTAQMFLSPTPTVKQQLEITLETIFFLKT